MDLSGQVKQLEQQLITANLEIANVRSQLQIEEQLVTKLKKEKEFVTQSETFGGIRANPGENDAYGEYVGDAQAEGTSKRKGTAFLKMFRFDKARTSSQKELHDQQSNEPRLATDQSIDYARYLVEIQEGKQNIIVGTSRRQSNVLSTRQTPKQGVMLKNVEK